MFATDGTDRMAAIAEQVGLALGDHYRVEELIGKGGAAIVFRVRDERLHRSLAVKALNPDLMASTELATRFRREARTAAALNHPNIVPIFFVGGDQHIPCFAMPLVEGESLGARIRREGQLPMDVALGIAKDIGSALDFAHGAQVIHRDVKPENILLEFTTGRSLLLDFGIAKALQEGDADLTQSGVVIGTPHYLSPEQAAGEKVIDGRADVYSLGVVVYEMLAGRPPFTGTTPQAIFAQHVSAELPALGDHRPGLPAAVTDVLRKATAKTPADRFDLPGNFVRALERAYGRRSLRTSGSTVVGTQRSSDMNLFRTLDVKAEEPAIRTLLETENFADLAAAAESVEQFLRNAAGKGDWRSVSDAIRALRRRSQDRRPAFRDPAVRVLERISDSAEVVESLATGWKSGDEQTQAQLEDALTASPGLAGHLLDLAIRERSAVLMLLSDRVGALTDGRVDALARDSRVGVVQAFVSALRESLRPAHVVERWMALVLQHPKPEARGLAVEAAGERGGTLAERLGRLALGDAAVEVRIAALGTLGKSGRREALPDLAQFLEHGSTSEQLAAAKALADLGSEAAAPVLSRVFERKRMFRKERGPLQEAAAAALARLPSKASRDTLRLLLGDRNERIAHIATAAIGESGEAVEG
ncbi:MAG: serine/threonine-protein kinase [Gemmatimonadetes bacterium]|nr:serine/threonine-protein kinase [Gemmatimonadota bacterium]